MDTFNSSQSNSFTDLATPFATTYWGRNAWGFLGEDAVRLAGFSVPDQVFGKSPLCTLKGVSKVTFPAVCEAIFNDPLESPISGLMGLAWQSIASSGAELFLQTLASSGTWDEPVTSFQIIRFGNISQAGTLKPGGTFTMGALNSSLCTGDIDDVDLPEDAVT